MKTTIKRRMRQEIAKGAPLVRGELVRRGMRGNTLSEMSARGIVYRVARGIYAPAEGSSSEFFDYELAAKVVPSGVFTLRSALRIHGLTDENPMRMTIAVPAKSHAPKTVLPIDFVYMNKELLAADVLEIAPVGRPFKVFSTERTLVECFKSRSKIGIAVCVAALKEAFSKQSVDLPKLWQAMVRCRMTKVMSPYLEGLA